MIKLSLQEARQVAVTAQLLGHLEPTAGADGRSQKLRRIIEHLGYVQIDTISVIERAHHHILWSRLPDYDPADIKQLEADRSIFEYWSHAASYLPMVDFRFSLPKKEAFRKGKIKWFRRDRKAMQYVLDRIRQEGPLMSKDFKPKKMNKSDGKGMNWARNPMNLALRQLFMEGKIVVVGRQGFQKIYDLPENVIPSEANTSMPSRKEYIAFLIDRDIRAHGLVQQKEIGYLLRNTGRDISEAIDTMVAEKTIIPVIIEGIENSTYYTKPELLTKYRSVEEPTSPLQILSPFDNLVIQRNRLKELFDFDYVLECYVPAAKRKFGYFSLPLLYDAQLVGQIDLKADRKEGILVVKNLAWRKGQLPLLEELYATLKEFGDFNKCEKISGLDY